LMPSSAAIAFTEEQIERRDIETIKAKMKE
jgi:hypothetical protein